MRPSPAWKSRSSEVWCLKGGVVAAQQGGDLGQSARTEHVDAADERGLVEGGGGDDHPAQAACAGGLVTSDQPPDQPSVRKWLRAFDLVTDAP
ncbi:hypothetical protein, partial [Saccharothrix sp. Mg75]|uniref:hypothetical protein n=1 Tax=Saccharothrix sp. Mg75 TaxID=3445357 RepID=UPI003EEB85BE